jgi:5-methyltetrahydrofolate--homocysteine methyltransferase
LKLWRGGIKTLVADGAWGTELFKLGLPQGKCPEEWNISHPVVIRKIAENYLSAGSDVVMTNTFGGNRFQLENHGLYGKVKEINKIGAALSREACNEKAICAASMGPSGKLFIMGEVSESELFEAFSEQAQALKDGGADWLVVETMTDVGEMEIAVRAAVETGLPVTSSMTYELSPSGYHTVMGHTPQDAVATAVKAGASFIGANCGCGIDTYIELAFNLRKLTTLPLWIKANAGLPQLINGQPVYKMTPEIYASHVETILDAQIHVIGGCCGTDPQFIKKIRDVVDIRNAKK